MSQPKTITIGGMKFEPITSPGPCTICGQPADGLSYMGNPDGREWQLCGSSDCWDTAGRQASEKRLPKARLCGHCGRAVDVANTHVTRGGGLYCSMGCAVRSAPPAVPADQIPSAIFQKAGPEAVALRLRWSDVDRAAEALGAYLIDRPEIANDSELLGLAEKAEHALTALREGIQTKLRKLCGVVP